MDKLVVLFQDSIKRAIAPSAVFFFLLAAVGLIDVVFHENRTGSVSLASLLETLLDWGHEDKPFGWFASLLKSGLVKGSWIVGVLALLTVLGMSYVLSLLHQFLFDDRLRGSFDALWWSLSENAALRDLHKKVVTRIQDDLNELNQALSGSFNDYLLYEILGGIDPTSTRAFVDRAKSTGITFVSLMLVLILWAAHLWRDSPSISVTLVVLNLPLWLAGREAVKTEYRARAVRLYVNFLMMPRQRLDALLLSGGHQPEISKLLPKKSP